jgi:predicted transcriptional regulator
MKIKIGTVLEDEVVQKLKEFAVKERKPMNEIIQEALITYLQGNTFKKQLRLASLKRLRSVTLVHKI